MVSKCYIRIYKWVGNLGLSCTTGKTMYQYGRFVYDVKFIFFTFSANCSDQINQLKSSHSQCKFSMIFFFFFFMWLTMDFKSQLIKKKLLVGSLISVTSSKFWTFVTPTFLRKLINNEPVRMKNGANRKQFQITDCFQQKIYIYFVPFSKCLLKIIEPLSILAE